MGMVRRRKRKKWMVLWLEEKWMVGRIWRVKRTPEEKMIKEEGQHFGEEEEDDEEAKEEEEEEEE